jgi:hypothetical protein
MGMDGLIVATKMICSPNVTVAPTFSSSIPDCARAGRALNRLERAITARVRSERREVRRSVMDLHMLIRRGKWKVDFTIIDLEIRAMA